jgi:hypothetical protein
VPAVLLGTPKISRAGTPFNYDWEAARKSVQALADLEPKAIGCGHGPVISGSEAAAGLQALATNYPVPAQGRYVNDAARTNANGVEYLPPAPADTLPRNAALIGAGLVAAGVAWIITNSRRPKMGKALPPQSRGSRGRRTAYRPSDGYVSPEPIHPVRRGVGD